MTQHGKRSTYVKGCHCADCRAANARYAKLAKFRSDTGRSVLVDARPVRNHLQKLREAGVGKRTIAARSGVSQTVVDRLLGINSDRPAARVRPETAKRLLSVRVEDVAAGTRVSIVGTQRRLQALIALGWTQTEIAQRVGWTVANLNTLVHGRSPQVNRGTHERVQSVYEELSMLPGPSDNARRLALRYGWCTPLAWDDDSIDDPASRPSGGTRTPRTRGKLHELVEDYRDTWDYHLGDVYVAAPRLGMKPDALERALHRARRDGNDIEFHRGRTA